MKSQRKTFRNVIARDLRTPKYRSRMIGNKKKQQQKQGCRGYQKTENW